MQPLIEKARQAYPTWAALPFAKRREYLEEYQENLRDNKERLAETISQEVGKPLWESRTEVDAMIGKIPISIEAYLERTGERKKGASITRHKPHGLLAVLGPFNFPGHLPNGHIVPALLAGNVVILKPSEKTPRTADEMVKLFTLPDGVLQILQGGKEVAEPLVKAVDGVLFTGSFAVGEQLRKTLPPGKILALEMGGNNPLIAWDVEDRRACAYTILLSAFLTSGQRCTCARRLIIPDDARGVAILDELIPLIQRIKIGKYNEIPEPFMGPLIDETAAKRVIEAQKKGTPLLLAKREGAFVTPAIIDMTDSKRFDEEIFGPLLQVIRVKTLNEAIKEANNTAYGLSAGILTDKREQYDLFYKHIHAGIVNWNKPLTGASSSAPFGGIGKSGNFRPSAYYAADYCSYPVASLEEDRLITPKEPLPGVTL